MYHGFEEMASIAIPILVVLMFVYGACYGIRKSRPSRTKVVPIENRILFTLENHEPYAP
jgi:hypothetical protein